MNWVDHGKTLREQGVDETEILLLRRKYFYSDANVDARYEETFLQMAAYDVYEGFFSFFLTFVMFFGAKGATQLSSFIKFNLRYD